MQCMHGRILLLLGDTSGLLARRQEPYGLFSFASVDLPPLSLRYSTTELHEHEAGSWRMVRWLVGCGRALFGKPRTYSMTRARTRPPLNTPPEFHLLSPLRRSCTFFCRRPSENLTNVLCSLLPMVKPGGAS